MDKADVVYICNGILFSHETEGNPAVCDNKNEPWEYYAKWNKSDRKRQIQYDFTYMCNLKKNKLIKTENRVVVTRG